MDTNAVFSVEQTSEGFRSVFPKDLAANSRVHLSKAGAWMHLIEVREAKDRDDPIANPIDCATTLWEQLGSCAAVMESDGTYLDEPFLHFTEGTELEAIWHWFEATFDISVAKDLMGMKG